MINSRSPRYNFCEVRCQTIDILIQYRTNSKSAAVINDFRHILIKRYMPFTCHLSRFNFFLQRTVFFLPLLMLCIVFAVMCATFGTVHNMLDDVIQKK